MDGLRNSDKEKLHQMFKLVCEFGQNGQAKCATKYAGGWEKRLKTFENV